MPVAYWRNWLDLGLVIKSSETTAKRSRQAVHTLVFLTKHKLSNWYRRTLVADQATQ